jgi:hypothetical protein
MPETPNSKPPFLQTPLGLICSATLLGLLVALAWGLIPFATPEVADYFAAHPVAHVLARAGMILLLLVPALMAVVYFMIGVIRWAVYGASGQSQHMANPRHDEMIDLLRSINERLLVSDTAKRLAYREQDREALRRAIRDDIEKHDFEAAMVLVTQMSQAYGYRQEAEEFRDQIVHARAAETAEKINQAVAGFEKLLQRHDWDTAAAEANKIQRLYPDAAQVRDLAKRVREVRDQHKHDLERQFLQAAEKDDVELAIDLLKELDKYLTEAEAEPFRETARGVIGKKRQNLGVQFKLAVHDKEWMQAVRVGEQIIREFPNSKMSDEVRRMLDLLRERAAGEQAARPRETV